MVEVDHNPEMVSGLYGLNGDSALGHVVEGLRRGTDFVTIHCKYQSYFFKWYTISVSLHTRPLIIIHLLSL